MSDVLLDFEKKSLEFQLKVTESPLSYIKQQCVQESRIALYNQLDSSAEIYFAPCLHEI